MLVGLQNLLNNTKNPGSWLELANAAESNYEKANILAKGLSLLPKSDLWLPYLELRIDHLKYAKEDLETVENEFNTALSYLPTHKQIWKLYFTSIPSKNLFNRSLESLDESFVWPFYLEYLQKHPDYKVYSKYVDYAPEMLDAVVEKLLDAENEIGAIWLLKKHAKSFEDYKELMLICTDSPDDNVEVFEKALSLFKQNESWIVPQWAVYHSKRNELGEARKVLIQGLENADSIASFCIIYDAGCKFHDRLGSQAVEKNIDPEKNLDLYEEFLKQRPLFLNNLQLKLYPNSETYWLERAALFDDEVHKEVLNEALETINDENAGTARIWLALAEMDSFDVTIERALAQDLRTKDRIDIYVGWARHKSLSEGLNVLERAICEPRLRAATQIRALQLELSLKTGDRIRSREVFDEMVKTGTVSAGSVLSLAQAYDTDPEAAFSIYERGLSMFGYPIAELIWKPYLEKLNQIAGVERLRDAYENALKDCPAEFAAELYLEYGNLEATRGLDSRALSVYKRAVQQIPRELRLVFYRNYCQLANVALSTAEADAVCADALASLFDHEVNVLACELAEYELKRKQVPRARALYAFAAQVNDPATPKGQAFYKVWEEMELEYGSEESYRDFLATRQRVTDAMEKDPFYLAQRQLAGGGMEFVPESQFVPKSQFVPESQFSAPDSQPIEFQKGESSVEFVAGTI